MKLTKAEKEKIASWQHYNDIFTYKVVPLTTVMVIVVGLDYHNKVQFLKLRPQSWVRGWV